MAKRIFKLPTRQELTKSQRAVLRLPKDGQHLITGAPGTGKSVVALWRLQEIGHSKDTVFLTFNHVLNHANKALVQSTHSTKMNTAMSWFYELQWSMVKGTSGTFEENKMPELAPHKPDYEKVTQRMADLNVDCSRFNLIIDEGQDLPPEWFDCIESLKVSNFFVVADQNQQITEERSSLKELQDALGIDQEEVIELKENWRNTTAIAAFANYFYTDKTSPRPLLPNRPSTDTPIMFEYDNIDLVKEQILNEYDRDPSKLIGFFVANENKRNWWAENLADDSAGRKNAPPLVSTYFASQKGSVNINFNYGGVVVLNDKSVKGIEFDTVFILIDGFKTISNDKESLMKRMYVMSSRAREKLFILKSSVQDNILESILPPDGESITTQYKGKHIEIELLKRRSL